MKVRIRFRLLAIALFVAFQPWGNGQGTVIFANYGHGVHAPVSGADIDYIAYLVNSDSGESIGEPAPFVAPGLFNGAFRTVPGVPGGSFANLFLFVTKKDCSWSGRSREFRVQVANNEAVPAETPAPLTSLTPGVVESMLLIPLAWETTPLSEYSIQFLYDQTPPVPTSAGPFETYFVALVNGKLRISIRGEAGQALFNKDESELMPGDELDHLKDLFNSGSAPNISNWTQPQLAEVRKRIRSVTRFPAYRIEYRRLDSGELELRWPRETALFSSPFADLSSKKLVFPDSDDFFTYVRSFNPTGKQFFYWLEGGDGG